MKEKSTERSGLSDAFEDFLYFSIGDIFLFRLRVYGEKKKCIFIKEESDDTKASPLPCRYRAIFQSEFVQMRAERCAKFSMRISLK